MRDGALRAGEADLSQWTKRLIFAGIFLNVLVAASVYSLLAPFFPGVAEEKGVSSGYVGILFAVFSFVVLSTSPMIGVYMSQLGIKKVLLWGLGCLAVSTIAFAVMEYFEGMKFFLYCFVLRIAQGVGSAATETAGYAITARMYPGADLTYMMGLLEVACGLGFLLGPPIGGLLYGSEIVGTYNSALPFLLVGSFPLPTLAFLYVVLPPATKSDNSKEKTDVDPHANLSQLFGALKQMRVVLILLCGAIAEGSMAFIEPVFELHVKPVTSKHEWMLWLGGHHAGCGFLFAIVSVLYCFAVPVAGYLAQPSRLGSWGVMGTGLFFIIPAYITLAPSPLIASFATQPSLGLLVFSMILIGFGQGCAIIPNMQALVETSENDIAIHGEDYINVLAGCLTACYSLGSMVCPLFGAFLTDFVGFPWACNIFALLVLIQLVATSLLWRHKSCATIKLPTFVNRKNSARLGGGLIALFALRIVLRNTFGLSFPYFRDRAP